jgi:hypothetical protein
VDEKSGGGGGIIPKKVLACHTEIIVITNQLAKLSFVHLSTEPEE